MEGKLAVIGRAEGRTRAEAAEPDALVAPIESGMRPPAPRPAVRRAPLGSEAPAVGPGTVLGCKYRLLRALGEGGMGAVYVAKNLDLDIDVAVKMVRASCSDTTDDERLLACRLLQEARAAARLGHEAIARVFDVGAAPDGSPYVVMELLEGETLAAVLDRDGSMPPQLAVQILLPIADALAATHAKGIVHRDIKPENVFLARTDSGRLQPKLIDFGVAKVERRNRERMTAVGSVVGSPAYVSPEQAMGEDVDAAADIWSFCVVLYETIRGAPPFAGEDIGALLRAIIDLPHDSLADVGVADERLSRIIDRGLTKSRADRFASMDEVGTALAIWLVESGVMEDVAGHSVHAKWLENRAAPTPLPLFAPTVDSPFEGALGFGWEDTRPGGEGGSVAPVPPSATVSTPRLRTADFVGVPMVPSDLPPRPDGQPHQLVSLPVGPAPPADPGPAPRARESPPPVRAVERRPEGRAPAASERPRRSGPERSSDPSAVPEPQAVSGTPSAAAPGAYARPGIDGRAIPLRTAVLVATLLAALAAVGGWLLGSCRSEPAAGAAVTAPR